MILGCTFILNWRVFLEWAFITILTDDAHHDCLFGPLLSLNYETLIQG